ncbi:MAG: ATP synthase F1 subunit gamma, partial [Proteobacteria bacterium]
KELKRRIASVKSSQQITKAMKMVAAARLRRSQEAVTRARPFAGAIRQMVQNLIHNEEIREHHTLLTKRDVKSVNVILITSDRGLCGGFNANLTKKAEQMYRAEAGKYTKFTFTCIGKKGYEFCKLRGLPVDEYYLDFQKTLSYAKTQAIANDFIELYEKGEYDEIRMIYSEFRSAISQVPTALTLLPVDLVEETKESAQAPYVDFLYEPSRERILDELLPRYFKAKLFRGLLESAASENGARMSAMDNATKNAGEMIKKLTLAFNKIRQGGITTELLEIVSGAEALK